jgi:hypothetical protein
MVNQKASHQDDFSIAAPADPSSSYSSASSASPTARAVVNPDESVHMLKRGVSGRLDRLMHVGNALGSTIHGGSGNH